MRNEQVADVLHGAAIRLLRYVRKEDVASGITGAQLSVLSVLAYGGPQTLGALAQAEQVGVSAHRRQRARSGVPTDARSALAWLRHERPSSRVGVIGCSLGGAAVLLGGQPSGFDAAVFEAVYPRAARAIENRIRIRLGSLAPVLTPFLLVQLRPRLGVAASDLEPIRSIGRFRGPVLIAAGSEDRHTTLDESRELFEAAAQPKELWVVPGAMHQDLRSFDPIGYEARVVGFLARYLRPVA